jgi:two-component system sensor histidine kinase CiaH
MFSIAFYNLAAREIQRVMRVQELRSLKVDLNEQGARQVFFRATPPEDIQESRQRLAIILLLINGGILIFAGGAAYFLAGITLKPISEMVDEQNRFITDSSHELRTPLTSLRSEIEVALRNKNMTPGEARKLLESNLEETISLQALSDHLLELSQNGNVIQKHDMNELSIAETVTAAIKKVEPMAKKKNIVIRNKVAKVNILGVDDRLKEVFIILLDNAVKYSPAKSDIDISSKTKRGEVKISVTNHGVGIEKEDLAHIFNRFYRADKSRSETSGYGLGLSIAKKIVESHNGKIEAKSIPGKQTTFTLTLPAKV